MEAEQPSFLQTSFPDRCARALLERLRRFGALTLEDYMAHCLADARFGYYRRARLGEDFVTAPMLSDALGLAVGSWLVASWRRLSCPREVMLVEAGAGGGELLGDVLRVVSDLAPESLDALSVHVVEINETARERLAHVLSQAGVRSWKIHETLEEVPRGQWLFLANEFFDALPIRQYLWSGGRSFVRRIALDEKKGGNKGGNKGSVALRFVRGEPCPLPSKSESDLEEGRIVEMSPRALFLAFGVARMLAEQGGAAFVCDYGYCAPRFAPATGSLQAFYRHREVDPLTHIGACDLSAEVDFHALSQIFTAELGEGGECHVQTQSLFLGAFLRAVGVESKAVSKGAQRVLRRLIDADAMGEKFKVLTAFAQNPR